MQLIKKYENISDIINSSRKENKHNMNSNLLQVSVTLIAALIIN